MRVPLNALKRYDWEELVNRNEAILCRSITHLGYMQSPKITGVPWQPTAILNIGRGPYYYRASELESLSHFFARQKPTFFLKYRQRLLVTMKRLDRMARTIKKTNCALLSKSELQHLLRRYFDAAFKAHCFLAPLPIAGSVLEQKILALLPKASTEERQQWLFTLTFPEKENEHTAEERSFYRLASAHHSKQLSRLLQLHLKLFAWIGGRWYWLDRGWTEQDIKNRLHEFRSQRKNPATELERLEALREKQRMARKELLQKFGVRGDSALRQYSRLGQEFAHLRTLRTDVVYGSGYRARGLFFEIARRAGMKRFADVVYLTCREVKEMARTQRLPITPTELQRRKIFNALFTRRSSIIILSGPTWKKHLSTIEPMKKVQHEVRGVSAFPGKAKGIARLVIDTADIAKVKRGNVLVAVMTFPHFIPAMEKAAAFVTDEGGILCHAAIVAREMQKPCVIGTKVATKVLKDGDRVEVDAINGIVKKL